MKLGLLTSIMPTSSLEEVIEFAAQQGFSCIEAACWPKGRAKRRYAGVTHIDVEHLDDGQAARIKDLCRARNVEISSLAYYPNVLDEDENSRKAAESHLKKVIDASRKLEIGMVTTFIGRNHNKTIEENLEIMKKVWTPLLRYAEEREIRIAIENCPMLFGKEQWPGGQNLFGAPAIWREVFEILPSSCLGINYDPSHFIWQMMDYIQPIYEFKDKIFHVHIKDIKIHRDRLDDVGTMAYPLSYMQPKIPGLGDIDWGRFISALMDTGYDGAACIEIEDRAFEGSAEDIRRSIILSKRYMEQFII